MRIIRPIDINTGNLTASNVPLSVPAAYAGGTTYDEGDRASVLQGDGFTYAVYESLQDGNTGHAVTEEDWWLFRANTYAAWSVGATYDADDIVTDGENDYQSLQAANTGHSLEDTAWWLDLGPTNRLRMFDQSNTSQTVNGESIEVTVAVTGVVNSVSFLNVVAESIRLRISTDDEGLVYDQTISLVSSGGVTNWWEYFFEPVTRYGDWTFNDLPTNLNATVRAFINDPGGTTKVGSMVIGLSRNFGQAIYPSSIGIQDYSRKEVDDFGYYTIVQRNFAKRAQLKVAVDERNIDALTTVLADLRATPVVFIGVENYRSTWIYGFYKDWTWQLAGPNESYLNFELEGLT